jgi:hypothetical protein
LPSLCRHRVVSRGRGRRREGIGKPSRASPPRRLAGVEDPGAEAKRATQKAVRERMGAGEEDLDAPPPNFVAVAHIYTSAAVTAYAYTSAPR